MLLPEDIKGIFFEKPKNFDRTWSDILIKEYYSPEDIEDIDQSKELTNPGEFPYTRGIHKNGYRGRLWTRREVTGFGSPKDTNERWMFLLKEGSSGLNAIVDIPGMIGIDADNPKAIENVGLMGVSLSSIKDMEELCKDMPLHDISISLITPSANAPIYLSMYIAVAAERGFDQAKLRGMIQNDPLHFRYCGFKPTNPIDLGIKCCTDIIEYCSKNMPLWYPCTINSHAIREGGINAAQEIAFAFARAKLYIDSTLERGLTIDDFAPRLGFYSSTHMEFFEEIAKLRAARKIWAKMMKEQYGARNPKSMKWNFGVHTVANSLTSSQPLNNIIRITTQAMSAIFAGVSSLHCCSYDEPIGIPTETSHRLALRTQQILAYETGIAKVVDPLGGSYYLEYLTKTIEKEIYDIMQEIENIGGMDKAMESGWVDNKIEEGAIEEQRRIDEKEQIIVGMNSFKIDEESENKTPGGFHETNPVSIKEQIEKVKSLKRNRNNDTVKSKLNIIKEKANSNRKVNLIPFIVDAVKSYCTVQEIMGNIREAYGYSYDPLDNINIE